MGVPSDNNPMMLEWNESGVLWSYCERQSSDSKHTGGRVGEVGERGKIGKRREEAWG